jgi:uncharacterized protein
VALADSANGMAIPFRIGPGGGVEWAHGAEKVRQNVRVILSVRLGERPLQREFGTRIPALAHEPNDDVLVSLIEAQAREALLRWEPRLVITRAVTERGDAGGDADVTVRLEYVHLDQQATGEVVVSPNA